MSLTLLGTLGIGSWNKVCKVFAGQEKVSPPHFPGAFKIVDFHSISFFVFRSGLMAIRERQRLQNFFKARFTHLRSSSVIIENSCAPP